MGVYVKGMGMPKSCSDCLFFVDGLYDANDELCSACLAKEDNSPWGCGYEEIDGIDHMARRMDYCPLVEVAEPHGDLVDRDILEQELRNGIKAGNLEEGYEHYANINSMDDCVECVRYAGTVIEAEGE